MKQVQVYKYNSFNVVRIWSCIWKEQKKEEIRDPDNTGENITIGKYVNHISHDTVNNRLIIDVVVWG